MLTLPVSQLTVPVYQARSVCPGGVAQVAAGAQATQWGAELPLWRCVRTQGSTVALCEDTGEYRGLVLPYASLGQRHLWLQALSGLLHLLDWHGPSAC